jgi:hypothetical protein
MSAQHPTAAEKRTSLEVAEGPEAEKSELTMTNRFTSSSRLTADPAERFGDPPEVLGGRNPFSLLRRSPVY